MNEKLFMNCDEVSKLLTIKKSTIYSWLHYRQLPENLYCKIGRKPLFFQEAQIAWDLSGAKLNPKLKRRKK